MKNALALGLLFLILGLTFSKITHSAPTPEMSSSLLFAMPAFGVFILFVLALFSLGALVRTQIKIPLFKGCENAFFDLSVGSAGLYLLSYSLHALHLFSSDQGTVLWITLAALVALGAPQIKPRLWFQDFKTTGQRILLAIPLLVVLLKLIEGLQFSAHGDAYNTYLPAPRIWAEQGSFAEYKTSIQYFLATSWESLYAWGTALMALPPGRGLDLSQFFSQWCSGGIAVLGVLFGSLALSFRLALLAPVSLTWFPVISLAALQIPVLRWTENLAKNDFGICFWGFSAFYFSQFFTAESSPVLFLAGFILGASVVGKFTCGIFAVILALSIFLRNRKSFLFLCLGGLLGIAPILIRNEYLSGDPFFPWLSSLFPSPLIDLSAQAGAAHATELSFHFDQLSHYLSEILFEIPWLVALIGFFFLKPLPTLFKHLILVPVLSLLAFTFFFRPSTEIRYQGPSLIIASLVSIYFLFYFAELKVKEKWPKKAWILSLFISLGLLANSNISFFTLFQLTGKKFGTWNTQAQSLSETGGPAKQWIRKNIASIDTLFILGDDFPYYLLDYHAVSTHSVPDLEKLMMSGDLDLLSNRILSSQNHFLYLSSTSGYVLYRPVIQNLIAKLQKWNQNCLKYDEKTSQVWDLKCAKSPTVSN